MEIKTHYWIQLGVSITKKKVGSKKNLDAINIKI